ncbi:MAG: hypothetical protein ACRC2W_16710 [Plesiomonas shigelloides]
MPKNHIGILKRRNAHRAAPRIILASALMALALWFMESWLDASGIGRIPGLAILVIDGAVIYFTLSFVAEADRVSELKAAVRGR